MALKGSKLLFQKYLSTNSSYNTPTVTSGSSNILNQSFMQFNLSSMMNMNTNTNNNRLPSSTSTSTSSYISIVNESTRIDLIATLEMTSSVRDVESMDCAFAQACLGRLERILRSLERQTFQKLQVCNGYGSISIKLMNYNCVYCNNSFL